jgi:hypothetical protein
MSWQIFGNFIYRNSSGDMKAYTSTQNLTAGADTTITTTIASTKKIYSVEFIDSSGNVITIGLGQPAISTSGGYFTITVYSTDALTGVILRVIFK